MFKIFVYFLIIICSASYSYTKANTINFDSIQNNHSLLTKDSIVLDVVIDENNKAVDSSVTKKTISKQNLRFSYKQLIIPSALIAYGVFETSIEHNYLLNRQVKHEVSEHVNSKFTVDNITQYVPLGSVYTLNLLGIKGQNNFKDRTIILGLSTLIMSISVNTIKYSARIERPDKSAKNSFPSGHTAVAFMGAEFLWQEYKKVSIAYGILGYTIATGTGILRLYNDKHWFGDVLVGAGIGILSTKVVYWIYPYLQSKFMNKKVINKQISFAPFYDKKQVGMTVSLNI